VVEFLGGTPEQVPDHYREASPMQLPITHAEQHIIHGVEDDVVPFAMGQQYVSHKVSKKEKITLLELQNAGHYELIDPESAAWLQVDRVVRGLVS
jgi:pimeloyl-ACP methyl ester carboxylesterase